MDFDDHNQFRMPFGKHKGLPVGKVPPGYLEWALATWDFSDCPRFRDAIRRRLRQFDGPAPEAEIIPVEATIRSWYRGLATKYHPDRGGSELAMIAINEAHDRLRELFKL